MCGECLRAQDIRGYMLAEYEASPPDRLPSVAGVPKLAREIKELCRKYSSV